MAWRFLRAMAVKTNLRCVAWWIYPSSLANHVDPDWGDRPRRLTLAHPSRGTMVRLQGGKAPNGLYRGLWESRCTGLLWINI